MLIGGCECPAQSLPRCASLCRCSAVIFSLLLLAFLDQVPLSSLVRCSSFSWISLSPLAHHHHLLPYPPLESFNHFTSASPPSDGSTLLGHILTPRLAHRDRKLAHVLFFFFYRLSQDLSDCQIGDPRPATSIWDFHRDYHDSINTFYKRSWDSCSNPISSHRNPSIHLHSSTLPRQPAVRHKTLATARESLPTSPSTEASRLSQPIPSNSSESSHPPVSLPYRRFISLSQ